MVLCYPYERGSCFFSFSVLFSFPREILQIMSLEASMEEQASFLGEEGVHFKGQILFSIKYLTGKRSIFQEERRRFFHSLLQEEDPPSHLFCTTQLQIESLWVETINQKGLITHLGVNLSLIIYQKIFKALPPVSWKKFLVHRVRQTLEKDVLLGFKFVPKKQWKKITKIKASLLFIKGELFKGVILIWGQVEFCIYYLNNKGILCLDLKKHSFQSFFSGKGSKGIEKVQLEPSPLECRWDLLRQDISIQLVFSLGIVLWNKEDLHLPVLKEDKGRSFYLDAILEQGKEGFLLEETLFFSKKLLPIIKEIVPEFTLLESKLLHKGLFVQGKVKIQIYYYLQEEGVLKWKTFTLPFHCQLSTKEDTGEIESLVSIGEILYKVAKGRISLTIPLQLEYYLVQKAPYQLLDDEKGVELECLAFLGRKIESFLLSFQYYSLLPVKKVEEIQVDLQATKVRSIKDLIYLEGRILCQIYYLSEGQKQKRFLSFEETFNRVFDIQELKDSLSIETHFTLKDLEFTLDEEGQKLKILTFWEVEFLMGQKGRFFFTTDGDHRERYSLLKKGIEERIFSNSLKRKSLPLFPLKAEVEILNLEDLSSRVTITYRYILSSSCSFSYVSEAFSQEILLPLYTHHEQFLILKERVERICYFFEGDQLKILFHFSLVYQQFIRDE